MSNNIIRRRRDRRVTQQQRELLQFLTPIQKVLPFYSNTMVYYYGASSSFIMQMNNMTPIQKVDVKVVQVVLIGQKIKDKSLWILYLTIALSIFLFGIPLHIISHLNCFKKIFYEQYNLNFDAYRALSLLISQCPNVEQVMIHVQDNFLDVNKAAILERGMLQLPRLASFNFRNSVPSIDMQNNEYSNFKYCFQTIKQSQRIVYDIRWYKKHYHFENIQVEIAQIPAPPSSESLNRMVFQNPEVGFYQQRQVPPVRFPTGRPY